MSAALHTEFSVGEAENLLGALASVFFQAPGEATAAEDAPLSSEDARYRTLVEQIPAVLFMVYLDRGIGEAYVSPHIEATLGFSQSEWLEDPIRWFRQIHPDDSTRWSAEAAEMFLTGNPLRSVYRVIARDGHVVWFHCQAKIVRRENGQPWFIQGLGFDITDLKRAEQELQEERNFVSTILDTVDTLVMILDTEGRIVRFNRACQQISGLSAQEVRGADAAELFENDDRQRFLHAAGRLRAGERAEPFEGRWLSKSIGSRLISWSGTVLRDAGQSGRHLILTGVDITEAKRLQNAILDISAREQQRIGQDLHDGLGQHLTGIAFMSKVLEQKLAAQAPDEAADAGKIVKLVNQAIHKTRELSHGLLPVVSDSRGLMSALERRSAEVADLFGIVCRFQCERPVLVYDDETAMNLYHIAQEAVNNAIKHGHAGSIVISLGADGRRGSLSIADDGGGIPEPSSGGSGMGLHIMRYRAQMAGGSLEIRRRAEGGTEVVCRFDAGEERRAE